MSAPRTAAVSTLDAIEAAADAASALEPLSSFFSGSALRQLHDQAVAAEELPPMARRLLDHDQDMTSTLEAFAGEPLRLEVLARRRSGDALLREVVLVGERSGRRLEFGAIQIHLDAFPAAARADIEAGRRPLGALLARHGIAYSSRPTRFLRLTVNDEMAAALALEAAGATVYGRQNLLLSPARRPLAAVVEILPPLARG